MGSASSCCTSSDGVTDVIAFKDEGEATWRSRLLSDVGRDPLGVTRDFPRTQVYVSAPHRNNYCRQKQDRVTVGILKDEEAKCEYMEKRNERVCESLELLMELCGEDTSAVMSEWGKHKRGVPDLSSLLTTVLSTSGMLQPVTTRENNNADNESTRGETVEGVTAGANMAEESPMPSYTVHSRALRLMQYMVQSIAFFSTQYVIELLRFPWCKHMQDISWAVFVYPEPSSSDGDDVVVLQHKNTLRHYVGPDEQRVKPRFEIEWVCTFRLSLRRLLDGSNTAAKRAVMGPNGEVLSIHGELVAARVEKASNKLCCATSKWKKRRCQLERRLQQRFLVGLTKVSSLEEYESHCAANEGDNSG
uniref:WGS project CAEQ00000000 data, annotated contig 2123 n=1 Tax=Trypanosoma congolense (strain IL3000) TaxID=1068625 RepID=F9WBN4_TRYCI|nr:unnamed protein product [Trypanosoma congolense IL3000]